MTTRPAAPGETAARTAGRSAARGASAIGAAADATAAGRRDGCAAAAIFTYATISRRSDARLTGAPGVYFRMKTTAPSSSACSVVAAANRVTPLMTTTETGG